MSRPSPRFSSPGHARQRSALPGPVGIRMRRGHGRQLGAAFHHKLPSLHHGVSFSDKDEKVYFSALPPGTAAGLNDVSIKELLPTITCLLTLARIPPSRPRRRDAQGVSAGAGENYCRADRHP